MQFGIRKTGKTNALKRLNQQYGLGLSDRDIDNMSTSQLMKKIFAVKKQYNLKINKSSRLQLNPKSD